MAQELSQVVLPSEDEIILAFEQNEINFEQMNSLLEIIRIGLNKNNPYLLDEIPNLSLFLNYDTSYANIIENDQKDGFESDLELQPQSKKISGNLNYKYQQHIEEEQSYIYSGYSSINYGACWHGNFHQRREYSGKERITYRNIYYYNRQKQIRKIYVGSYTVRFGLGSVYGYRGKMLDYSDEINTESFLFPDYGGYNGFYAQTAFDNFEIQSLYSINRDSFYTISSYGTMLSYKSKSFQPSLVIGLNKIKNRDTKSDISDLKISYNNQYDYKHGTNAFEITYQSRRIKSISSVLTEGRHRFADAEIKYAGWYYDERMIDISSGSKSSRLTTVDTLSDVEYEFRNKRAGQKGMILKTIVNLNRKTKLSNSLIYGQKNKDSLDVQWMTTLTGKIRKNTFLSLNFLSKYKKLKKVNDLNENRSNQTKIELRYKTIKMYIRSHLSFTDETNRDRYISIFTGFKYDINLKEQFELWIDLNKINLDRSTMDYWYSFIRYQFEPMKKLITKLKLSHRFNRNSDTKNRTQFSLELSLSI